MSEELEVASACWLLFKKAREWPSKKLFARSYPHWAAPVLSSQKKWPHIHVSSEIRPDWELLFILPETRTLLAPLPAFIRDVAARVVANPIYRNDHSSRLNLTLKDFERFWSNADTARLAADLLTKLWNPWLGWGSSDSEGVRFHPHLDVLRYEHVQGLDELLQQSHLPPSGAQKKVAEPEGTYLQLLHRIHEHLKRTGTWPEAVPFTVAHRDLGFIPDLVDRLEPEFIRRAWKGTRDEKLKLTFKSLDRVTSAHERHLLAQAVRAMAQIWLDTDEPDSNFGITAEMVAHESKLSQAEVGPLLRYLEQAFWVTIEPSDWVEQPWKLLVNDKIGLLKNVEIWEDYLRAIQEEEKAQHHAVISSVDLERLANVSEGFFAPAREPPALGKKGRSRRAKKAKPIFISHAAKDKELVDAFVELLVFGMGVDADDMVCSSLSQQAVPLGNKFRDYLRDSVNGCSLFICLVSKNFYASTFALCEVGAAWGANKIIVPVMVPPLGPEDLEAVLQDGWQAVELLNGDQLAQVEGLLRKHLGGTGDIGRWNHQLRKFLKTAREVGQDASRDASGQDTHSPERAGHDIHKQAGASSSVRNVQASDPPDWQTFVKLVGAVRAASEPLSPVLRAAAYATGSGMAGEVIGRDYKDIRDAEDRGMLVFDANKFWADDDSRLMRSVVEPFNALKGFLQQASDRFHLEHEKRYGFVADMQKLRFAEVHIGFSWVYGTPDPDDNIPF
ncbi:toll/interleukin-1 receptor domain-containing protein [Corallococcus exiguus]|uniref:toll/interleukin-1 receptor domain-containing protein n=1 Tax=Corallococcus exiguus TaxID=83462 RepID=UPI003DA47C4C